MKKQHALVLTFALACALIVLTSAAGFSLASERGATDYVLLAHALFAVALLSSGVATLNQYMERDLDRLMRRTASRPATWTATWCTELNAPARWPISSLERTSMGGADSASRSTCSPS